jgi:hypothetical protein
MRFYRVLIETLTIPLNGWPTVFSPPLRPTLPLSLRYHLVMLPPHLASLSGAGDAPALFA